MKNKKMSIRISEEHLAAIHRKAEQADMTFTDYVTKSCLGRQIVVIDGLDGVLRQQKAIGRNLNQLTMLCNMGCRFFHRRSSRRRSSRCPQESTAPPSAGKAGRCS